MKQAISSSSTARSVVKQVIGGRSTLNLVNTPHNLTSVVNFSKSTRVLNQPQQPKPAPESVKYNKNEQLKSVASNTKGGQESKSGPSLLFKFLVGGMVISAGALGVLMYLRDDIEKLRTLEKQVSEQQSLLNQYKAGSSSISSEQKDTEKDREEKIRHFNKKASSETSALESHLESELRQIEFKLGTIQEQLTSIQSEKSTISQKISSLQASQESIQQELSKLQTEKKDLLQAIDNFAKHSSTQVDISTLKSNEGPVSVQEREQFVIRIQQIEMQLAAKEKLLTQVQQDYDSKILKIQTLAEQETKLEVEKMSTQLSAKQTELELLKEKLQRELNDEKIKLQEDMTKSLKEQATEVGTIYATHLAKKDQQLKQVEEHLQKLEQTFNSSIGYINDSLKIQEYTTAIISLKDAAENKKQGFKKELEKLRQISKDDELVQTTLSLINDNTATKGACTLEELRDRFATVKKKALTSSLAPPKAGFFGFVYSKIASVFVIEEQGLAEGDSVNAALSRAEYYLKHRRLEEALVEIVKVCEAKDNTDLSFVLADWMKEAADRVVIDQTVRSLQSHLLILSQSVQ